MTPEDSRYAKSHEYVHPEAGDTVVIGITDYAQKELGDVVFVELPAVGKTGSTASSAGVNTSRPESSSIEAQAPVALTLPPTP